MSHLPDEKQVGEGLSRLADSITVPPTGGGADLARGRRRARWRRTAIGVGAATAVVVVAAGSSLLGGAPGQGGQGAPGFATRAPSPSVAIDSVAPAPATDRELPIGETMGPGDPVQAVVEGYATVLAEHLDPQREHVDLPVGGRQSATSAAGRLSGLGAKIGWRQPGEGGLGMLQLSVGPSVSGSWTCGAAGWTCSDTTATDGTPAAVATHDGVLEVRVRPAGRAAVTLTADPLFANNSLVPISSLGLSDKDLLAAAADPRLVLPEGLEEPARPSLAVYAELRTVGESVLVADGETLRLDDNTRGDTLSLINAGPWSGPDGRRGSLSWSMESGVHDGTTTCDRQWYSRCAVHTEDGSETFVGYLVRGGWRVIHPGESTTVTVEFDGDGLSPERAFPLVTDPRFQ